MAAPRTWVTAELVSASIMNAHVRDMLNAIASAKGLILGIGDFAGAPLTPGVRGYFLVPFGMRVTGWTLLADAAGDLQLDVWRDTYANFPPTVADTITGTEKPKLVAQQKNQDVALSSWATDINAGDVIGVNVDSTSGVIKQATLTLAGSLLALV
jgi:hypothetical protein